MKKTATLLLLLCFTASSSLVFGQKQFPKAKTTMKAPWTKVTALPDESLPVVANPTPMAPKQVTSRAEEVLGTTYWDAQCYGSMPSRVYANSKGEPAVTWLHTKEDAGYTDRGTGYSYRENGTWNSTGTRIENVRVGFPAATSMADGTELVVSHNTSVTPYKIRFSWKAAGSSTWNQIDLPATTDPSNGAAIGMLWPRITVGGADGKTIHVLAVTTPVANQGVLYDGVDGQVLYTRSTDAGATWDAWKTIPGLDKSKFRTLPADSYTIEARDNNVAVAVFPDWNDLTLFKSDDNGSTWTKTIVNDFPDKVENYDGLSLYTFDDLGGVVDPDAPDSLAVFSSDGFGSLLLDHAGQAHLWFGYMYFSDDDPATNYSYYPGMNGLCYWNESKTDIEIITGALDYTGDTALAVTAITEIGPYYNNLASFATTGLDDDGNLYLAYAALHELYRSTGAEKDQFYRHVYMMKSVDGGTSWGEPVDIMAWPYYQDTILIPFNETVYPAIPRNISNKIWLAYQLDNVPGTDIWGDNHSPAENSIVFVEVEKGDLPATIGTNDRPDLKLEFSIAPNPVSHLLNIRAQRSEGGKASIQIFDIYGKLVQNVRMAGGEQVISIPVNDLPSGTYVVKMSENGRTGVQKFMKL